MKIFFLIRLELKRHNHSRERVFGNNYYKHLKYIQLYLQWHSQNHYSDA